MIKNKKQMYIVVGVFALVLMLGTVTYAFFNYTRTGAANTIRTGRIAFNSTQGQAINLTNVFPIDVTNGIPNNSNVGSVTINVTGDTTYTDGVEYLVSAVNVQNTIGSGQNAKTLPISIDVSVANNTVNDPATTLGTSDTDYFTNRGANANTSIYKVLAGDVIANNDQLVVGYIKSGATGVDGNIVIKAYLDKSKIGISDTYPEEETDTNNDGYIDGTPSSFGTGRTIFTTTEWNSLQQNGVSFQIKVEANEGIWVEETTSAIVPGTIVSCPGCKFIYTENQYDEYYTLEEIIENGDVLYDDYNDVTNSSGMNIFLGVTINDTTHRIEKKYACGIKGTDNSGNINQTTPFCLEASTDRSTYNDNVSLITGSTLWDDADFTQGRCTNNDGVNCAGSVRAAVNNNGHVSVLSGYSYCDSNGSYIQCGEY